LFEGYNGCFICQIAASSFIRPHRHEDHEEVYYIINGTGKIKIGNEEARLGDGDIIYIPENITHSIINDGEQTIDFLYLHWRLSCPVECAFLFLETPD
jgi:mannose-6-phosphate isomerase-like protein (cupin superfamily)